MMPGMNMNQLKKMMKDVEQIPAQRVIIEGPRRLVIENPQVTRMNVMGQSTFQIVGESHEEAAEEKPLFTADDVNLVIEQTGMDEDAVREALERNQGDIAKTILDLKG